MTHSNLFDFRLNYRDHRKIVTIDGKIGYVGGFNVGDQYLGRLPKFGYWRDTHLRVIGGASTHCSSDLFVTGMPPAPRPGQDHPLSAIFSADYG